MTRDEVFHRVRDIISESFEFNKDFIRLDSHLVRDLDLDSVDAIDVVVRLQELTGRRIEDESLRKVATIGDVVDLVESHLSGTSPAALIPAHDDPPAATPPPSNAGRITLPDGTTRQALEID